LTSRGPPPGNASRLIEQRSEAAYLTPAEAILNCKDLVSIANQETNRFWALRPGHRLLPLGRYPASLRLARGLSKPQLRRVTAYIEESLDQDLSLSRLAEVAEVSASHLKTLFKRSTGLPVHEYVIQRRDE
jgi:methylphosphotriester-DNA--protein-cysteine methyltransferase